MSGDQKNTRPGDSAPGSPSLEALCLGARIAQEHLGIPMASIELQPALLRSLIDAGMQGRVPMGPGVPRWAKKAFFKLADTLIVVTLIVPTTGSAISPPAKYRRSSVYSAARLPTAMCGRFSKPSKKAWLKKSANSHLSNNRIGNFDARQKGSKNITFLWPKKFR
jgi:hypothetical protein